MINKKYLPDFLLVGAAKSGTTSLYKYLNKHPQIFMPIIKEPCFFSSFGIPKEFFKKNIYPVKGDHIITDCNKYKNLFKKFLFDKDNHYKISGEASTHYLFQYRETIKNIKYIYGLKSSSVKIIIILRNPVEASYSNYRMWLIKGYEKDNFENVIKNDEKRYKEGYYNIAYIHKFSYYNQVKAYMDNFDKVKIYLFDDLKNNPKKLIIDLFKFLNIEYSYIPKNLGVKYNVMGFPKNKYLNYLLLNENIIKKLIKPFLKLILQEYQRDKIINRIKNSNLLQNEMTGKMKACLIDIFEEDIKKLQILINKNLRHWVK